ncbi:MAG: ATP synthase F1 subunit delta [Deltaproteobacteria bacterium]|nr:ATP synthase F1 subunit delta [Deltaproteobacteria bacterium]
MISGSLARRYARAFLSVTEEAGEIESCGEVIEKMAVAMAEAKGVLETLSDRSFPLGERLKAMEEILGKISPPVLLRNFLFLLVEKGRIGSLPEIAREFSKMRDERLGIVRVGVLSAVEPSKSLLSSIEKALSDRMGKKVIAKSKEDRDLIGGVVLKIGHTIYDGSVKRELEKIQERMIQGSPSP